MAEKDSGTNDSVRGYNLIDEAKKTLEATCPSTVMCRHHNPSNQRHRGLIRRTQIQPLDEKTRQIISLLAESRAKPDPTMDPALNAKLEILAKKGLLQIDQQLALDAGTKGFVLDFASNGDKFQKGFANAIVKMGEIDVLVGNQGEIRKKCSVFNRN
ncbi:Peroxidase 8 [Glycine soja]|uniref:peroxidase n=1 Tax=Glycine soja TaxID=3848 RepID=A0A445FFB6_GLYSO|nr:Peroxidase 8 [Glycine soja]